MANREVNLTKYIRHNGAKRYCPAVLTTNGKVKPDWVFVDGKQERHPEGSYYLDWYEGTKRIRRSVGKNAVEANNRRLTQEAALQAKARGVALADATVSKRFLSVAIADFLEETKLTKKPKTLAAYTTALRYFADSCSKQHVEGIERKDLLKFSAFLRDEKEQSPRSCWNKFSNVMSFFKANGIRGLAGKNDWPRYTEEEPEVYEDEELVKLFDACDSVERLWFEFFLMTGMREQEVMYTYWSDINFSASMNS